jgi:hypothetical protein
MSAFKELLKQFQNLGGGFGRAAIKLVANVEDRRIAQTYAAGLASATTGLSRLAGEVYQSAQAEQKLALDQLAAASGLLEMLGAANQTLRKSPFESPVSFGLAGHWFRKTHQLLRDILPPQSPGTVPSPDPLKLLPGIELLVDNLRRLVMQPPRACHVEIRLVQLRYRGKGFDDPATWKIRVAVNQLVYDGQRDLRPDDVEGDLWQNFLTFPGRCGGKVRLQFVLNVRFPGADRVGLTKGQLQLVPAARTYPCPSSVDSLVFRLRHVQIPNQLFYEFEFEFAIALRCAKSA